MTNFEKFIETPEKLAILLAKAAFYVDMNGKTIYDLCNKRSCNGRGCEQCMKDWLNEEYEEGKK